MRRAFSITLVAPLAAAACALPAVPERDRVAVSVLPQAFVVEKIAGDDVEITVMLPPGASPASYAPDIGRMRAMSHASLYLKVGHPHFPFERAWLDTLLGENREIMVIDATSGTPDIDDDPHVWLSPPTVRRMATSVAEALRRRRPERTTEIDRRLAGLLDDIDALDADLRRQLSPYRGRRFLVFHPAWSHFAREYGLRQVAIEHGHREPSAADLAAVIRLARENGLRTVFVQPQFSDESARLIADEIGGKVVALDPLARDWAENLRRTARLLIEAFEA